MARAFRKGVTGIFIMMAGCCASKKASHQTDERPLLLVTTTLRHRRMDLIPYGRGMILVEERECFKDIAF